METPEKPITEMTREELNAYALELGVTEPDKLANKDAVIAAITEAQPASATDVATPTPGVGTASAPDPAPAPDTMRRTSDRIETYEAVRPNGERVRVTHNIDTGETTATPIAGKLAGVGVAMVPGSGAEPVGPEDALGKGPTRGDYRTRIGPVEYHPHEGLDPQRPRADEIGDVPNLKGGVQTTEGQATS
jgi:hypothetical protein